jgi:shikimate kinase
MVNSALQNAEENGVELALPRAIARALDRQSIVLVGMMGAGKSSIGRRLAARLGITFVDADSEIESAAGMTIAEIFAQHGEPYFRAGEARVIARLLDNGPQVLATGGGAFMDQHTRDLIHIKGISVWLKADLDVLMKRTKRRNDRPLADKMHDLLPLREPVYSLSDIIVDEIVAALASHLKLAAAEEKQP